MSDLAPIGRPHAPLVRARSDADAIHVYLSQTNDRGEPRYSPRTLESYRRDIKRLLVFLDGRSLASVTLEDVHAFTQWLRDPPHYLVDPVQRRRINDAEWRPFYRRGLSPAAVRQQMASIKAFYRWLSDAGYIAQNAFGLMPSARATPRHIGGRKRELSLEDLRAVSTYLSETLPSLQGAARKRLARQRWLWFGYLLSGLRISEFITHTTGHLHTLFADGEKIWMMSVTGKGGREVEQTLPDGFMQELWRYRTEMGLEPWPRTPQPLVLGLSGRNALTSRSSAHNEFKELIQKVAVAQREAGRYDSEARLAAASTHWLRHSFVTTLLDITTDVPAVADLARHRDIRTTMGYDHSALPAKKALLNKLASTLMPSGPA